MSNWIILLLIIVVFALAWFKKKSGKGPVEFPYQSKEVLCSPAERSFLGALDQIVGKKYRKAWGQTLNCDYSSLNIR